MKPTALITPARPHCHVSCHIHGLPGYGHLWGDMVLPTTGLEHNPGGSV